MMTGSQNKIDKQMLLLIDVLKTSEMIKFDIDFCKAIGMIKSTLPKIRQGNKSFTTEHVRKAVVVFEVNANWIFGLSDRIFVDDKLNINILKNSTQTSTQKLKIN